MGADSRKSVIKLFVACMIAAGCLFGAAGTLRWWNAWAFMAALIATGILTEMFFRKSPDLAEERKSAGKKAKSWDKFLAPLPALALPAMMIVSGLDVRTGRTGTITIAESLCALAVMAGSFMLTYRAMGSNPFFSSYVRIQDDRGHAVASGGPYRFIRHPGYAGAIFYNLAAPVLLGSCTAFFIGLAVMPVFIVRTALEDKILKAELKGYREYAGRVRYRLVPFVW